MEKVSGIGFSGLLTLIFIVLKLTHVITWAWIWIISPIWISAIFVIAVLIIIFIIAIIKLLTIKKK